MRRLPTASHVKMLSCPTTVRLLKSTKAKCFAYSPTRCPTKTLRSTDSLLDFARKWCFAIVSHFQTTACSWLSHRSTHVRANFESHPTLSHEVSSTYAKTSNCSMMLVLWCATRLSVRPQTLVTSTSMCFATKSPTHSRSSSSSKPIRLPLLFLLLSVSKKHKKIAYAIFLWLLYWLRSTVARW